MPPAMAPPLRPWPPAWVGDLFAGSDLLDDAIEICFGVRLLSRRGSRFTLLSGVIDGAAALPAPQLSSAVAVLYRAMASELTRQDRHCVRIWNFVPDIQGRLADGDRYMTFNAGRFTAYFDWFGGTGAFAATLPTASAIGVEDRALSVYALAADEPGQPIENPRQIPSYRYSSAYGVRPPCFSRATKVGSMLLIGGTASILGQDSQHEGDIDAQVRETCGNIAALIGAATRSCTDTLQALRNLRVHVRDAGDTSSVRTLLDQLVPGIPIELVQAPLCRRELLVEIEGVAECPIGERMIRGRAVLPGGPRCHHQHRRQDEDRGDQARAEADDCYDSK
jgi:chorismate lyase / 3-hydroxybenzoate synthase